MIFRKVGPSMATPGMRPFQRRAMPGGMPGGVSGATTSQVPEPEQQEGLLGGSAGLGLLGLGGKSLIDSLGSSGAEGLLPWMTGAMSPTGNVELAPWMNAAISQGGADSLAPWMTDAMSSGGSALGALGGGAEIGMQGLQAFGPGSPATDIMTSAAGSGFDPISMGIIAASKFGLGLLSGEDPGKSLVGAIPFIGGLLSSSMD